MEDNTEEKKKENPKPKQSKKDDGRVEVVYTRKSNKAGTKERLSKGMASIYKQQGLVKIINNQ